MKRTLASLGILSLGALVVRRLLAPPRFDLRGRIVLVTGGGRGLGLQIARECAARGAKLALVARSRTELERAANELRAKGARVEVDVCDVRDTDAVATSIELLTAALGPIDAAFNVAGVIEVGPVDALSIADYEDAVQTNFLGAVRVVEHVRAAMVERESGRIVNVSSLGGAIAIPHLLPYSASKFAIRGYSEGLRSELRRYGVYVSTILPGLMRTGSSPQATFAGQPEKEYAMFEPSDSLPFTSVSVAHAARRIVDACERGSARTIISAQAKLAIAAYAVMPNLVNAVLALGTRALPDAGASREHRLGVDAQTPFTRSAVDALGHEATRTQHEDLDRAPISGV